MRIILFILAVSAGANGVADEGTPFPDAVWLTDETQTGGQPELLGIDWEEKSTAPTLFHDTGLGWLGKRMVRVSGGYAWPAEGSTSIWTNGVERHVQMSGGATINFPAPWSDFVGTVFSHDVFVSGRRAESEHTETLTWDNVSSRVSVSVDPIDPAGLIIREQAFATAALDPQPHGSITNYIPLTTHQFEIGTTVYASTFQWVRPFLQLGYLYRSVNSRVPRAHFATNPITGLFPFIDYPKTTHDEHRFLANVGFEGDISETLSLRCQFDVNTHHGVDQSAWSANLIYWPNDRWTFNIGAFEDMEHNFTGIQFGTGLAF